MRNPASGLKARIQLTVASVLVTAATAAGLLAYEAEQPSAVADAARAPAAESPAAASRSQSPSGADHGSASWSAARSTTGRSMVSAGDLAQANVGWTSGS